jgi:tRNA A37 threonylcarbamoyladenosine dehydratase
MNEFSRFELLVGSEKLNRIKGSRVVVFGVGGVGGYVVEALARCGVGALDIIDGDSISITNLNRQIIALHSTLGMPKTEAAAARIHDIAPETAVNIHNCFYLPETAAQFDFSQYDYVIDAIDTVKGKIEIVMQANAADVPVISSMGAGNKLDPTAFRVADIYKTKVCPLARVMRYELKKRGIQRLKVVYSEEAPLTPAATDEITGKRTVPGSTAFVPSVAGLIIAGEVIKDLTGVGAVGSVEKKKAFHR